MISLEAKFYAEQDIKSPKRLALGEKRDDIFTAAHFSLIFGKFASLTNKV